MKVHFLGGAGTVTGSKYLLETEDQKILIDAGLFQGEKELRELNWEKPKFNPMDIDAILLTHTHMDHAGFLPRLVKLGFRGPVYATPSTKDLARVLLMDGAKIQEEDAYFANKRGFSKHKPALPLYTSEDVEKTMTLFRSVKYETPFSLGPNFEFRFVNSGHILGSAMIACVVNQATHITFSGDVGRYKVAVHKDPFALPHTDVLVVESTYGNRLHEAVSIEDQMVENFLPVIEKNGVVLIPSFAVGRAQQLTYILRNLMESRRLPEVPIHMDSPMAIDASEIYQKYNDDHHVDRVQNGNQQSMFFPKSVFFHRTKEESQMLGRMSGPRIIISSSGMLTGGRILHHLEQRISDPKNLLCLVGYQALGTRGRKLIDGAKFIRIHGRDHAIGCQWTVLTGLSGHADQQELLHWISTAPKTPKKIFVTHGEEAAAKTLAEKIKEKFQCETIIPKLGETFSV